MNLSRHPQLEAMAGMVHEFCMGYAQAPGYGHGYRLIIQGRNGVGKTHAARAVSAWAKRVAVILPLVHSNDGELGFALATAKFHNWPEALGQMLNGDWGLVEEMMGANLLVLDDVGAEGDAKKIGIEKLYLILEKREKRWTILTTNVEPSQWETKFDRRIASRLLRNTKLVPMDKVPDFNS